MTQTPFTARRAGFAPELEADIQQTLTDLLEIVYLPPAAREWLGARMSAVLQKHAIMEVPDEKSDA